MNKTFAIAALIAATQALSLSPHFSREDLMILAAKEGIEIQVTPQLGPEFDTTGKKGKNNKKDSNGDADLDRFLLAEADAE
jgi:hypothetical protein